MRFPGFVGGSYTLPHLRADAQRALNWYPEAVESGSGKVQVRYVRTPGLVTRLTLPTAPVRGLWGSGDEFWAVGGSKLYRIDDELVATEIGDVGDDAAHSPVMLVSSQRELFIASAGLAWRWAGEDVDPVYYLEEDEVQVNAHSAAWLDGMFIVRDPGTPNSIEGLESSYLRFRHSAPYDGSHWETLDYAAKESRSDGLVHLDTAHNDLWLWGTETTEIWRNNYSTQPIDFPWERDPGALIHYGNAAPWATVLLGEGMAWLVRSRQGETFAVHCQGYRPRRISTHAIEAEWASYASIADAEAYTYTEKGHPFWVISFNTANKTWVYDLATGLWHERASWTGTAWGRHRGRGYARVFGKHFVGDFASGKIYELDPALRTEDTVPVERIRTAPIVADEDVRITHHWLQLDVDCPAGTAFTLAWSDDSGKTYTAPLSVAAVEAEGDGSMRVVWRRLGAARARIYRVVTATPNDTSLLDAFVGLSGGAH